MSTDILGEQRGSTYAGQLKWPYVVQYDSTSSASTRCFPRLTLACGLDQCLLVYYPTMMRAIDMGSTS